jgi:hypothetical protein
MTAVLPRGSGVPGASGMLVHLADEPSAERAIAALEQVGVEGADLYLLGPARIAAGRRARYKARLLVARGAVLGTVGGMLVSSAVAGIGLLLTPTKDALTPAQLLVMAACTLLGALVGIFVSVDAGSGFSDSWDLAVHDVPEDETWLAVLDDPPGADAVLRGTGALEVLHIGVDEARRAL